MALNSVASGLSSSKRFVMRDIIHAEGRLERMRGLVLPAAAPVIAKFGDDGFAEIPDLLLVVFFVQEVILDLFGDVMALSNFTCLGRRLSKISCTSAVFMPGS